VQWEWALAAAAAVVMGVGLWMSGAKKPPEKAAAGNIARPTRQELPAPSVARVKHVRPRVRRKEPVQPLKVKMFTSDPDVVIYWIVDRKETFE
jgi:hypothetical protein